MVDLGALGRCQEVAQPWAPGRTQDARHKVSGGGGDGGGGPQQEIRRLKRAPAGNPWDIKLGQCQGHWDTGPPTLVSMVIIFSIDIPKGKDSAGQDFRINFCPSIHSMQNLFCIHYMQVVFWAQ